MGYNICIWRTTPLAEWRGIEQTGCNTPLLATPFQIKFAINKSLISTRIPAGGDPLKHKAGLLTNPLCRAFPIYHQWQRVRQTNSL